MPTYSYACTACDHRFDAQQSFSDAALTTCPECEGTLRKLFGNVGVVFKGPGFYRTDARAGNGRAGGAKKSSSSSSTTSSSSSSSTSASSAGSVSSSGSGGSSGSTASAPAATA